MKKQNRLLVRFMTVTLMLGLFAPSITLKTVTAENTCNGFTTKTQKEFTFTFLHQLEAKRGGAKRNNNARRSKHRSKNKNINVNHNVNVNVNHRYYGGGRSHHGHHHHGYYHGRPIIPFAVGIAIGSIIAASTMPSTCTTVSVKGVAYRKCQNEYYQPFYEGDTLVYKRVSSPY